MADPQEPEHQEPDVQNNSPEQQKEIAERKTNPEIDFPDDMPKEMRSVMSIMQRSGPMAHPIHEKITPAHITSIIESTDRDSDREFSDKKQGRVYALIYTVLGLGLLVFFVLYISKSDPDLLKTILGYLVAILGGAGAGYGFKSLKDKNR